jgi:hypothetical protein
MPQWPSSAGDPPGLIRGRVCTETRRAGDLKSDDFQSFPDASRASRDAIKHISASLPPLPRWVAPALVVHWPRMPMTPWGRWGVLLLLAVAGATGCAGVPARAAAPSLSQRLEQADGLVRGGRYVEAQTAYAAIVASGARADEALLRLSRLALDPSNPGRDGREAALFEPLDRGLSPESADGGGAHLAESASHRGATAPRNPTIPTGRRAPQPGAAPRTARNSAVAGRAGAVTADRRSWSDLGEAWACHQ